MSAATETHIFLKLPHFFRNFCKFTITLPIVAGLEPVFCTDNTPSTSRVLSETDCLVTVTVHEIVPALLTGTLVEPSSVLVEVQVVLS